MRFLITAFVFLLFIATINAVPWAVLVRGSRDYSNYRHEADVLHSYQVLSRYGFPNENIITMFYDDIHDSHLNPTKGIIVNCPNCSNVYSPLIPKDYTHSNVTPHHFLNVLQGNASANDGRKVLNSTQDDDVFVFWCDHGLPGGILWPDSGVLYAHDLVETIGYMFEHGMYRNLVFYLESCNSGSMFSGLTTKSNLTLAEMNVLAITASTPDQESFACFYDSYRETYLADVFSFNWIMNSQIYMNNETFQNQYQIVADETTTSTVSVYGNLSLLNQSISLFESDNVTLQKLVSIMGQRDREQPRAVITDAVRSRRAGVNILLKKLDKRLNYDLYDIPADEVDSLLEDLVETWRLMKRARKTHRSIYQQRYDKNPPVTSYDVQKYIESMSYTPDEFDCEAISLALRYRQ